MKRLLLGVALAMSLFTAPIAQGQQTAVVEDDKFSQGATILGPVKSVNPFGGTFRMWRIRAWVNKADHTVTAQLYVQTGYFWHWRFWEQAADDHANPLPVVAIDRSVDDCTGMCSYTEIVGVDLTEDELRQRAQDGFEIKLSAKSGDSLVLDITPDQIRPVLQTIDRYRGAAAPAANAAAPVVNPGAPAVSVSLGVAAMTPMFGPAGALITDVYPGLRADKAGIAAGDVVQSFDGQPIGNRDQLVQAVEAEHVGRTVPVVVVRDGKPVDLSVQF
jgi:membrane-associated protease RseP (regulator of RpoE activity)